MCTWESMKYAAVASIHGFVPIKEVKVALGCICWHSDSQSFSKVSFFVQSASDHKSISNTVANLILTVTSKIAID